MPGDGGAASPSDLTNRGIATLVNILLVLLALHIAWPPHIEFIVAERTVFLDAQATGPVVQWHWLGGALRLKCISCP
jgi:hypothetical protein